MLISVNKCVFTMKRCQVKLPRMPNIPMLMVASVLMTQEASYRRLSEICRSEIKGNDKIVAGKGKYVC